MCSTLDLYHQLVACRIDGRLLGLNSMQSNLDCGYALEDPPITVPWGLSRRELVQILARHGVRRLNDNNFVLSCKSLTGLSHELHFRFNVDYGPSRYMLLLSRLPGDDVGRSFDTFQRHLELTFGSPSSSEDTEDGFPYLRMENRRLYS
jgi:hypothetical protein